MNKLKALYNKYFGKTEYIITTVEKGGEVKSFCLYNMKEVNDCISSFNSEKYWDVQKIEKIKRYNFIYNKEVKHSPLFFCIDDPSTYCITEMSNIDNQDYSFLIKHKSLKNVNRVEHKNIN